MKVKVRLINKETEEVKEQEVFMGDFLYDRQRYFHYQWCGTGYRQSTGSKPRRLL